MKPRKRNAERRERRIQKLQDAQAEMPEGKIAIRSHGEIIPVTKRRDGEALVGKSNFTEIQLREIADHGRAIHERFMARKAVGRGYKERF